MRRFIGSVVLLLAPVIAVIVAYGSGASSGWTSVVGIASLIVAFLIALPRRGRRAAMALILLASTGIGGFTAARMNPPFAWEGQLLDGLTKAQETLERTLASGTDVLNRKPDALKQLFAVQPKAQPVAVTAALPPASSEEQFKVILKRMELLESAIAGLREKDKQR